MIRLIAQVLPRHLTPGLLHRNFPLTISCNNTALGSQYRHPLKPAKDNAVMIAVKHKTANRQPSETLSTIPSYRALSDPGSGTQLPAWLKEGTGRRKARVDRKRSSHPGVKKKYAALFGGILRHLGDGIFCPWLW